MNNLQKLLGYSALLLASGCAPPALSTVDERLGKYNITYYSFLSEREGALLIENEFDIKPKDGIISDEEAIDVLNYASTIPDNVDTKKHNNFAESRKNILDALIQLRNKQKTEKAEITSEHIDY